MPTLAQRALMSRHNQAAHGVNITVTPPGLDAVTTTGIWHEPNDEGQPVGADYRRSEPRRLMEIPRSTDLADVPKASVIAAVDVEDGDEKTWRVEGYYRPSDPLRVFVTLIVTG